MTCTQQQTDTCLKYLNAECISAKHLWASLNTQLACRS